MIAVLFKAAAGGRRTALSGALASSLVAGLAACAPSFFEGPYCGVGWEPTCDEDLDPAYCNSGCVLTGECPELTRTGEEVGQPAQATSSRLALTSDDALAIVALEDRGELVVVKLEDQAILNRIAMPGAPHRVVALGDGRFAVSLKDAGDVVVVDTALTEHGRIHVGAAPYSMAVVDKGLVAVAVSRDDAVALVDVTTHRLVDRIALTRPDPRGLAVDEAGVLLVGHFSPGHITLIDLVMREERQSWALDAPTLGRANQVEPLIVSPVDGRVHVVMQVCDDDPARFTQGQSFVSAEEPPPPSAYYTGGFTGRPAVVGALATATRPEGGMGRPELRHELFNPLTVLQPNVGASAAVILDDDRSALVVHRLSGTVTVRDLTNPTPFYEEAFDVGVGADAVVVDADGARAWVFNPFTRTLHSFDLAYAGNTYGHTRTHAVPGPSVVLGDEVLDPDVARGRELFHSVNAWMTQYSAIACASCHPGGEDDGVTWQFEEGPRQTQPLWGDVLSSGPVHWDREIDGIDDLIRVTIQGRMGGEGLYGLEREALEAFLGSILTPAAPSELDPIAVANGEALFRDPAVGCTSCHAGARLRDGLAHDVGTSVDQVSRETLEQVATPTLLGVGASAPYLHDGSLATLEDVVDLYVRTDLMGTGSHLSDKDAADLVVYLQSL